MNHELYVAASGMIARVGVLEVFSNNVANVATPGFKADTNVYSTFNRHLEKSSNLQNSSAINDEVKYDGAYVDYSQGTIKTTNNPLDVAIEGEGFFALTKGNNEFYTRAGNFGLDANGDLVTFDGYKVMGESGVINISSEDILINGSGEVYADGKLVDKIAIYSFNNMRSLGKVGDNKFENKDTVNNKPVLVEKPIIFQGAIEQPNYNIIKGMAELVTNLRMYETCQKNVRLIDELNSKVINQIGI